MTSRRFLAIATAFIATFAGHRAQAATLGSLTYEVVGSSVTITSCNPEATGTIVIPAQIEGKPVTAIGDSAFYRRENLSGIVLPAKLKQIGAEAFARCSGLEDLDLPSSVSSIGASAFTRSGLRTFTFPTRIKSLGDGVFSGCRRLESVVLPANLIEIPVQTFFSCERLKKVSIPQNVTRIGALAFSRSGINLVTIPPGVREIGNKAFESCPKLKSATFSGPAPVMGNSVFGRPRDLTIYLEDGASGFTLPRWNGFRTSLPKPEITVSYEEYSLYNGSLQKFPAGVVGNKGTYRTFTIRNTGIRPLTDLTALIPGDSSDFVVSRFKTKTLDPGKVLSLKVTFTPTATGKRRSELNIGSNDSNENPFRIVLHGTGLTEN